MAFVPGPIWRRRSIAVADRQTLPTRRWPGRWLRASGWARWPVRWGRWLGPTR